MSSAPQELRALVERFDAQRDAYCSPGYNETQLRREFVDPLFGVLGWDIDNKQGFAEAYKDVVHEDVVRIGVSTKAPDYAFRIGGTRKFFVEAKKPSIDVTDDQAPAFQLRRYAWSAGLALSVLTNFRTLAVYDTRIRPHKADKASVARVMLLSYEQFIERWDDLEALLSRDAILHGAFDRFAASTKLKRGTARVDDAFLVDIEEWRKTLASAIARDNDLSQRDINVCVQATLDRIIFLRIAEDRGVEPYGRLLAIAEEGSHAYARLVDVFREADDKYNSGLFHFRSGSADDPPDHLTLGLRVDDKALKTILRGLYYPESPFEFSVIPVEVLGHVYERFLGKQIALTPSHRATVEEKPLVRKAGGVFYTPTRVVSFIVRSTLGRLLSDKKAGPHGDASQVRVLDPACGSGSFLLSAYQHLLDWHRDRYVEHGPAKHRRELVQNVRGDWVLTIDEKKRILVNSIYGVDIDEQAVEVTKLSLLLKVLEGESAQTLEKQLQLFHERALPNLWLNIRCGNSLVGTDWYGPEVARLDKATAFSVNPFDWRTEFPTVFREAKGFDVVIGNPPYVSVQSGFIAAELQRYLEEHYKTFERISDYFALFIERSKGLLNDRGYFGMIVPSTVLGNLSFTRLRGLLLHESAVVDVAHLGDGVFREAVVPTSIIVYRQQHGLRNKVRMITNVRDLDADDFDSAGVSQARLLREPDFVFNTEANELVDGVLAKAAASGRVLEECVNIKEGIKTGNDAEFLSDRPFASECHRVLKGRDIEQFVVLPVKRYIHYDRARLSRPQTPEHFEAPEKLLIRRVGDHLTAAYDGSKRYCVHTLYTARPREGSPYPLAFLLGLLNSTLLQFVYRKANVQKGKVFPEVRIYSLNRLPMPPLDLSTTDGRKAVQAIGSLAEQATETAAHLYGTADAHEREVYSRKLTAIREQIDDLVFAAYKISRDEVAAVRAALVSRAA